MRPNAIKCIRCGAIYKVYPGFKICNCEKCPWVMFETVFYTYDVVYSRDAPPAQYVGRLFEERAGRYFPVIDEDKKKKKRRFYRKIKSQYFDYSYVAVEEEKKKRTLINSDATI